MVSPEIIVPLLYHWLPLIDDDVRVTLPPLQKVIAPPGVIVGVAGTGLAVTGNGKDAGDEHPFAVTITV